jgi:toxin CptA
VLKISLQPSRLLATLLIAAHIGAIALALVVDIPLWLKVVAATALMIQCVLLACRQALLLGEDSALALEVTSDHQLNLQTRAAGWSEFEVLGTTYVTPYLTVLNLRRRDERRTRHLTLLPDSLRADDFRKLRVWLRWKIDSAKS